MSDYPVRCNVQMFSNAPDIRCELLAGHDGKHVWTSPVIATHTIGSKSVQENLKPTPTAPSGKLPIDRPCSACSDGDSEMKHHDHEPPFRGEAEPAPQPSANCPKCGTIAEPCMSDASLAVCLNDSCDNDDVIAIPKVNKSEESQTGEGISCAVKGFQEVGLSAREWHDKVWILRLACAP